MTTFRKKKNEITEKMLRSITFADQDRYEIDETKLTGPEIVKMKTFLNERGYF